MEHLDLTLNKNKSFRSVNELNNISVDLESEQKLLPVSDLQGTIDAYEQYLKEKDACNKYRLVFTIHPYCTNVLFNHITEAVYKEGSDQCTMFVKERDAADRTDIISHSSYKTSRLGSGNDGKIDANSPITRDTGYTSDTYGGVKDTWDNPKHLEYNCGTDIFNNHLLRRKEFVCINKIIGNKKDNKYFNTIFDLIRDPWGDTINGFTYNDATGRTDMHVYNMDSIYSFLDGVSHNLREKDGWLGFYNSALLRTTNNNSTSNGTGNINKVINYLDECTFVDMYPTRQHYSFVPHVNRYRKRLERNWEYILTYPYDSDSSKFVTHDGNRNIDGIICEPELNGFTMEQWLTKVYTSGAWKEMPNNSADRKNLPLQMTFKTHLKHTILPGDRINIHFYKKVNNNDNTPVYTTQDVVVSSIGKNGYDSDHYFTLRFNDVSTDMGLAYTFNEDTGTTVYARIEKLSGGRPCKYYIRKFRKIPNFKNTKTNTVNGVTEDDILNALQTSDFSSSLNKLGFSKTIYGDDVAQIVYDDDIDVTGLRDNLNRELTVLYLTLVKTNYGYQDWYKSSPTYGSSNVEYSHCFGKVTSGFNLPTWADKASECNVRKQHNIIKNTSGGATLNNSIPDSSDKLETNVTVKNNYVFYGDIVELDENLIQETVLERVQHRFNTAQREYRSTATQTKNGNIYANLITDEIIQDDFNGGFQPNTQDRMCSGYWANLAPEGYYYQAHYPVKIKEFDDTVNEGYHTRIESYEQLIGALGYTIRTDRNYYFEVGDEIYLYKKSDNSTKTGIITNVAGDDFRDITFTVSGSPTLSDYNLFKPNRLKPDSAYEMNDGSGRYVWRDITPSSKLFRTSDIYDQIFTNGATYIHNDINFYLKRQDPFGEYGLLPQSDTSITGCIQPSDLEYDGQSKDLSETDYFEPEENNIC